MSRDRASPAVWEEHGAGRTDGLAVGAYPLPPNPTSEHAELVGDEAEGPAKERWLRRHYQWLRALGTVAALTAQSTQREETEAPAAFVSPTPAGTLRLGDLVVLYADASTELASPHLLDDGRTSEDPERSFEGAEAFDLIISDRLAADAAQLARELFAPFARGVRAALLGTATPAPRLGGSRIGDSQFESHPPPGTQDAQRRPRQEEPRTLLGFVRQLAVDAFSAPTTYVLTFLALLAWLVLRTTVFSRS